MFHFVDQLTQLPIARFHMGRDAFDVPIEVRHCISTGNKSYHNSGDMDKFGSLRCLEYLYMVAPGLVDKTIVTLDGDVKGDPGIGAMSSIMNQLDEVEVDAERLMVGKCYTHAQKNLFKFLDKKIPKVKCTCTAKSTRNHRCTGNLPLKCSGFVGGSLKRHAEVYTPSKHGLFDGRGAAEVDPDLRKLALESFKLDVLASFYHMRGVHALCDHAPIPEDGDEKTFCCPDQVEALRKYLDGMCDRADSLMTPGGLVHIQYAESNHSVFSLVRPKGDVNITSDGCFIGECIGLLRVLELQIPANDPSEKFFYLAEMERALTHHFNISINVKVDEVKRSLYSKLQQKVYRATHFFKKKRAERRARNRAANKKQKKKSGAYQSGGEAPDKRRRLS